MLSGCWWGGQGGRGPGGQRGRFSDQSEGGRGRRRAPLGSEWRFPGLVLARKMAGREVTGREDGNLHLDGYSHTLVVALGWTVPEK